MVSGLQWGTGTSNIFSNDMDMEDSNDPEGFGWQESRSAVVLAVGAIVIPAIDGFVNSNRVEQWNDKVWHTQRSQERRRRGVREVLTVLCGSTSSNRCCLAWDDV